MNSDIPEIHGDRDILRGEIQALYCRNREEAEEEPNRWADEAGIHSASR